MPERQRPLTASVCKDRSEHYAYYHCISPYKVRYRLEEAETSFMSFLKGISLDKPVLELLNCVKNREAFKFYLFVQIRATKLKYMNKKGVLLVFL